MSNQAQATTVAWDQDTGEVFGQPREAAPIVKATESQAASMLRGAEDGATAVLRIMVAEARGMKRDPERLIARAKHIGSLLGKQGFYRFPTGGTQIEGESIHLAQALAQEWGGIIYSTQIVLAEPLAGGGLRLHLRSTACDLVNLVFKQQDQHGSTAPAPGKFANKHDQKERWNSMQTSSAASKVERNAILDVLPKWFTRPALEAAKQAADSAALGYQTTPDGKEWLKDKDGNKIQKTLDMARADSIDAFTKTFKITTEELTAYVDMPVDLWAVPQIAVLRELFGQLKSGAISVEGFRAELGLGEQPKAEEEKPARNSLGLKDAKGEKKVD